MFFETQCKIYSSFHDSKKTEQNNKQEADTELDTVRSNCSDRLSLFDELQLSQVVLLIEFKYYKTLNKVYR